MSKPTEMDPRPLGAFFHKINVTVATNLNAGDVAINEIMADNTKTEIAGPVDVSLGLWNYALVVPCSLAVISYRPEMLPLICNNDTKLALRPMCGLPVRIEFAIHDIAGWSRCRFRTRLAPEYGIPLQL